MYIMCRSFHAANAWKGLSKLPKIPSLGKLKVKVKELNTSFDIYATPGDTLGAQQSLKAKLTERVVQLLKEAPQVAAFRFVFIACSLTRLRDVGM